MNSTIRNRHGLLFIFALGFLGACSGNANEFPAPYDRNCTQRENVFEFAQAPTVESLGNDRYEISFATKGYCDVTVGIIDAKGEVVRHLGSGVLGRNAPAPFQKNTQKQIIYWDGKDDLEVYVKEPNQLRVQVRLGLKPTFEKRLGGISPHHIPGYIWGLAADPDGVYVFSRCTHGARVFLRAFNHDGSYRQSLIPPPANMPHSKLAGWGSLEYERGKKALHAHHSLATQTVAGQFHTFNAKVADECQPTVANGKIYYCDSGFVLGPVPTSLYNLHTDGSSDLQGLSGRKLTWPIGTTSPRLASSPDGRWIYMATSRGDHKNKLGHPAVFRARVGEAGLAEHFLGKVSKTKSGRIRIESGSDNASFQSAAGIACDAKGRIYVADPPNNRVQVYTSDGKYYKTLTIDRPRLVQVHLKTGAIYILHQARIKGRSVNRLTKLISCEQPREAYHLDGIEGSMFTLDSWASKPRLWFGGDSGRRSKADALTGGNTLKVYEENGKTCQKILDFEEKARTAAGKRYLFHQPGYSLKGTCDSVRNKLYITSGSKLFPDPHVVDLATGNNLGRLRLGGSDDVAFDKRGYMHCHFDPGFYMPGVGRLDPNRVIQLAQKSKQKPDSVFQSSIFQYEEIPYDYGVSATRGRKTWNGVLPVKDQLGAKFFQDGIGVNMRGDIAVQSNIYYAPKMADESQSFAMEGSKAKLNSGHYNEEQHQYTAFLQGIEAAKKRGESVYSIKRNPGVPLVGGTIWTYESTGELREECAVTAGDLINGVQIDELGKLYFVNARLRISDEKGTPFLQGKGGVLGDSNSKGVRRNRNPLLGTLIKTRSSNARILLATAKVPMDPIPARPADLICTGFAKNAYGKSTRAWMDGAEWLYAGASPIVFSGCSCPTMRFHTDWYQRTFVPESYRNSIGVVDTGGNLIMHIGQYGNLDSGDGPKSQIPVGANGIGIAHVRFVSGTDDRLVFDDNGERIVVLKLDYHAEKIVGIGSK